MRGLDNPRHVHVAPDGSIYVAEAGSGGPRCSGPRHHKTCVGFTGSVSRLSNGAQKRAARGLLSAASKDGSFAVGADDALIGPFGNTYAIETSAGRRPGLPKKYIRQLGRLLRVFPSGKTRSVARIDDYEFRRNPDRKKVDSNPYAMTSDPRGGWLVADAAANDLLRVAPSRRIGVVATFPARRAKGARRAVDSVPTCVAVGPDGAFYVGELRGNAAPRNSARVWRIVPGHAPTVYASGLNRIVGLDFGPDGSLYVAELVTGRRIAAPFTGAVVRIAGDGSRGIVGGDLVAPGGVAVASDGSVYVSVNSVSARRGRVVVIAGPSPSPSASGSNPSGSAGPSPSDSPSATEPLSESP
ncbi:MAG: ScyD/ScyE family protein [Actinomycetota bacterium]|nr:ScyD/ScyE family protein [Actinomycetota bacterium]